MAINQAQCQDNRILQGNSYTKKAAGKFLIFIHVNYLYLTSLKNNLAPKLCNLSKK
jgi:hypothetical protein